MSDSIETQVEELLTEYDHVLSEERARRNSSEVADAAFMAEFQRIQQELILPTLERFGTKLKAHGHDYKINHDEQVLIGGDSHVPVPAVNMMVLVSGVDGLEGKRFDMKTTPHVTFYANRKDKRIGNYYMSYAGVRTPTGGWLPSSRGESPPPLFTSETVENTILSFLKEIIPTAS